MTGKPDPFFIAVDWGTSNLRAMLIDASGAVLESRASARGIQSVEPGGFQRVLDETCAGWLSQQAPLAVLMAGMVGSRNGWVEAPYISCPAGAAEIGATLTRAPGSANVFIVPGMDCRWNDGAYDVMRGEETQVLGTGVSDGLLCLPGTHSKWIEVGGGRITRFATFVTGELYAAMSQSFIGRLAEAPDNPAGVIAGARAAGLRGGLGRSLFQARSQVLGGGLSPNDVRPFLSGLIVENEIRGALDLFGQAGNVTLLASEPQVSVYRQALANAGLAVTLADPGLAFLRGIGRIAAMRPAS